MNAALQGLLVAVAVGLAFAHVVRRYLPWARLRSALALRLARGGSAQRLALARRLAPPARVAMGAKGGCSHGCCSGDKDCGDDS